LHKNSTTKRWSSNKCLRKIQAIDLQLRNRNQTVVECNLVSYWIFGSYSWQCGFLSSNLSCNLIGKVSQVEETKGKTNKQKSLQYD
jgi:hypothetical protein